MHLTEFSMLMAILWSSVIIVFNYLCGRKQPILRQFGIRSLLALYLLSALRLAIPYEWTFTQVLPLRGAFSACYEFLFLDGIGGGDITYFQVFRAVWAAVSAVLLLRFAFQYRKACRTVSSYSLWEGGQCARILEQVEREGGKEIRVAVRRSGRDSAPMAVGVFRKSILLPDREYTDEELYYILKHEYTHFRNRDLPIKLVVYVLCCVFWWNPAVYLLKKDLSQAFEIKCDLCVTEGVEDAKKAEYLETIVAALKKMGVQKKSGGFYGTVPLVAKGDAEGLTERFWAVSGRKGKWAGSKGLAALWVAAWAMLVAASYSFVIQPEYDTPIEEIETGPNAMELTPDNSYLLEKEDGTCIFVGPNGVENGSEVEEWLKEIMLSQGFELRKEKK